MDTSNPAPLVNAELLKRFTGRRVRCVLKVLREEGSSAFVGHTSDGMQLTVKHSSGASPLSQFVEVIGVADSDRSLRADIVTCFGNNFGKISFSSVFSCLCCFSVALAMTCFRGTVRILLRDLLTLLLSTESLLTFGKPTENGK